MTLNLTCKRCDEILAGKTEDELVARVQAHVRGHADKHGQDHAPTRAQILRRLARAQQSRQ